jgi:hypothetical protein
VAQLPANVFKRIDLIEVGATTGNQRVAQRAIAACCLDQHWRFFGANFVTQVVGDALHARAVILEALTGLITSGTGQQPETTAPANAIHRRRKFSGGSQRLRES